MAGNVQYLKDAEFYYTQHIYQEGGVDEMLLYDWNNVYWASNVLLAQLTDGGAKTPMHTHTHLRARVHTEPSWNIVQPRNTRVSDAGWCAGRLRHRQSGVQRGRACHCFETLNPNPKPPERRAEASRVPLF
jgi:hypothetical protein